MTELKKCPFCAEDIQFEAIKCKYCSSDLSAKPATKEATIKTDVMKPAPVKAGAASTKIYTPSNFEKLVFVALCIFAWSIISHLGDRPNAQNKEPVIEQQNAAQQAAQQESVRQSTEDAANEKRQQQVEKKLAEDALLVLLWSNTRNVWRYYMTNHQPG
jgi:hypothetical protein